MRYGVQMHAWLSSGQVLELASLAEKSFHRFWLTDQMQARHFLVLLSAIAARTRLGVGSCVSYAYGHNPVEMASAFATLAEIAGPEADITIGFGTGGGIVQSLFQRQKTVERTGEFIQMLRKVLQGERIQFKDFPLMAAQCGFLPEASYQLAVPVGQRIPVMVTGTGPKILRLAGTLADGIICASNLPAHSLAAFRSGRFAELSHLPAVDEGLRNSPSRPFTRTYGFNISIATDRETARAFARRHAVLSFTAGTDNETLAQLGIDPTSIEPVRTAMRQGRGIEEAAKLVPQEAADAVVVSGTPSDCIPKLLELKEHAVKAGFDEFYMGAPLGPNPGEAIRLLSDQVIPALGN
jgi:5,10-methylenetetrahydromethanopterin reductase